MPIITLTTDFGNGQPLSVAAMKGVILSINPAATIVLQTLRTPFPPRTSTAGH